MGDWKSIKRFYAAHRSSTNYRSKEHEINRRAARYIRQYEELLDETDELKLLRPDLEPLDDLTAKLSGKIPSEPASMESFYNKMVGRRVGLVLHLKLGLTKNGVYAALKGHLNPSSIFKTIELELRQDGGREQWAFI